MATTIILKSISIVYISLISFVSLSKCNHLLTQTNINPGFTIDLIHRDSPQSPSYNPSFSQSQRLANAFRRSFQRLHRFNASTSVQSEPEPDIINARGEYFLKYSVGTPPVPTLGIFDTGSDLIWTQCQPCLKCFKQNLPIFTPRNSSTYRKIRCNTRQCSSLPATSCGKRRENCVYSEMYGDGSFTQGELSTDTLTLASSSRGKHPISISNVVFGCGFRNGIKFEGGESGIVGLGGGKASLIRQLGNLAQGKFSYCLVSLSDKSNSMSKLHFGAKAVVSGGGTVSIPLVHKRPETFYYVTLEGISVGKQRLEFDDRVRKEGNIIVDSGTTLTFLPIDFYLKLKRGLQSSIRLRQVEDPQGVLDLCFHTRVDEVGIPDIVVHFAGADLKLKQENVLVRTNDDTLCLGALPVQNDVGIYGSLAQVNFLMGFDIQKRTVSFKPADCGRL